MRNFFLQTVFLLLAAVAGAQVAWGQPPQKVNSNYQFKSAGSDSGGVRLPKYATLPGAPNLNYVDSGAIAYRKSDSAIFVWTGTEWIGVGSGRQTLQQVFNTEPGGSVLTKKDTILAQGHTLYLLNGSGDSAFAIKGQIGDSSATFFSARLGRYTNPIHISWTTQPHANPNPINGDSSNYIARWCTNCTPTGALLDTTKVGWAIEMEHNFELFPPDDSSMDGECHLVFRGPAPAFHTYRLWSFLPQIFDRNITGYLTSDDLGFHNRRNDQFADLSHNVVDTTSTFQLLGNQSTISFQQIIGGPTPNYTDVRGILNWYGLPIFSANNTTGNARTVSPGGSYPTWNLNADSFAYQASARVLMHEVSQSPFMFDSKAAFPAGFNCETYDRSGNPINGYNTFVLQNLSLIGFPSANGMMLVNGIASGPGSPGNFYIPTVDVNQAVTYKYTLIGYGTTAERKPTYTTQETTYTTPYRYNTDTHRFEYFFGGGYNNVKLDNPTNVFTPSSGGSVSVVGDNYNVVNPAGTIAALTVVVPTGTYDNQELELKFDQAVTLVTYSGATVNGAPTAPVLGQYVKFKWSAGFSAWF